MSNPEHLDKLLLNNQQSILLFTGVDQIKDAISSPTTLLFDQENLIPWASLLTISDLDTGYDLDYLMSVVNSDLKQEQILQSPQLTHELVGFINLFGDYAYQVQQEKLLKLHHKRQVMLFSDYCYDTYFWTIPVEELQRRQKRYLRDFRFTKFKADMKQLLEVFVNHCAYMTH